MAKEDKDRTIHRYGLLIHQLGITEKELANTTPGEAREILQRRINSIKSEREEIDIAAQRIKVVIGETEYTIRQRSLLYELEMQEKIRSLWHDMSITIGTTQNLVSSSEGDDELTELKMMDVVLPFAMTQFPVQMVDLFFDYAKLDKDEILKELDESPGIEDQLLDAAFTVFKTFLVPFLLKRLELMSKTKQLSL